MTTLLVRRARIVPIDAPAGPSAEPAEVDVRIRDGVIAEVSPRLAPHGGEDVLDAAGRWAIPGLWDHHVHLGQWAATLTRLDTAGTASAEEVLARLRTHLADPRTPDGAVLGFGHRSATWPRTPTVAELDAVTGPRPVVLISGDAHHGWLNSAALDRLGATSIDGSPVTGPIAEAPWFALYARLDTLPGVAAARDRAYPEAVARAHRLGVVGVVDMEFDSGFDRWPHRVVPDLRVRVATYPDRLDDALATGLRSGDPLAGLVELGPLKIISDGSLNTRTAWCCEPYAGAAAGEPATYGAPNQTPEELTDLLRRATAHGWWCAVHAIGDAAVSRALDTFAATGARGTIEHAQLMRRDDLARMAALGVAASVQPAHLLDDRDVTITCWPDRTDRCFPLRSLHEAGVELRFGSDAPVSPLDPWLAMAAAVHRSADERGPWHGEQALTPRQALAASVDGQRLAPGSRGDLVLLDDDPLTPGSTARRAPRRRPASRCRRSARRRRRGPRHGRTASPRGRRSGPTAPPAPAPPRSSAPRRAPRPARRRTAGRRAGCGPRCGPARRRSPRRAPPDPSSGPPRRRCGT